MMTSGLEAGDVILPLESIQADTDTSDTQRHDTEVSRAELKRKARPRPQRQTSERFRFLKYPLRYILPKPTMLSPQPGTAMAKQPDIDDLTAPHPDQENWSLTNLPDILYVLRPGTENAKSRHRVHSNVGPIFGKMIRNLPVLPNHISSHVEGWRLEAWMRLDRRVTAEDIMDRVDPRFRMNITEQEVDYRRRLFRQNFHIAHWGNQKSMNEICRMVKDTGRDPKLNSTRGLTPGLIVPAEGEAGGRIPLPQPFSMRSIPVPKVTNHGQPAQLPRLPTGASVSKYPGQSVFAFRNRVEAAETLGPCTLVNDDSQPMDRPELKILYETPSKAKLLPADDSVAKASIEQPDTPDSKLKRKADISPADIFGKISRTKRKRPRPEAIPSFPRYPSSPMELASHEGPPARSFPSPPEPEPDYEMSLEEYLETNNLGYLDFLNARYYDDLEFLFKPRTEALD